MGLLVEARSRGHRGYPSAWRRVGGASISQTQLPGKMTDIAPVFVGREVHGDERSDPG